MDSRSEGHEVDGWMGGWAWRGEDGKKAPMLGYLKDWKWGDVITTIGFPAQTVSLKEWFDYHDRTK